MSERDRVHNLRILLLDTRIGLAVVVLPLAHFVFASSHHNLVSDFTLHCGIFCSPMLACRSHYDGIDCIDYEDSRCVHSTALALTAS